MALSVGGERKVVCLKTRIKKKLKKQKARALLDRRAGLLRADTPPAEKWFQFHWRKEGLGKGDHYNRPWGWFIPDCVNHERKYVIEIDEAHHQKTEQKERDARKDKWYTSNGYCVFRIKAYSEDDFRNTVEAVKKILSGESKPPPSAEVKRAQKRYGVKEFKRFVPATLIRKANGKIIRKNEPDSNLDLEHV